MGDLITTNSAGRPIATSDAALHAFWRWFGDSKVVDQQGRPEIFYHGTGADFDAFDTTARMRYSFSGDRRGLFFTNSTREADLYAHQATYGKETIDEGSRVIPVYLRVLDPYVRKASGSGNAIFPAKFFDSNWRKLQTMAEKKHADGIIVHGSDRAMCVVYDPKQVKSAIGNRTWSDDAVLTNPPRRLRRNSPRHQERRSIDKQLKLMSPVGRVYVVDGSAVRQKHTDFIGGGHHAVYSWIPAHEVWIERMRQGWREERFLLAHEMAEIVLMQVRKWGYDKAHEAANGVEGHLRIGAPATKVFADFVAEHFPRADGAAAASLADSLATAYEKY